MKIVVDDTMFESWTPQALLHMVYGKQCLSLNPRNRTPLFWMGLVLENSH